MIPDDWLNALLSPKKAKGKLTVPEHNGDYSGPIPKYNDAAFRDKQEQLAITPEGSRTVTLNTTGFIFGMWVKNCFITKEQAEDALYSAAESKGFGVSTVDFICIMANTIQLMKKHL